jgi:hypothetical protein
LERQGETVALDDLQHITPLGSEHIRILGRYRFDLHPAVAAGALRPLRHSKPQAST